MTTLFCEGETDTNIVWQIGYELISLFNGASVLFNKNYHKASIFKLLYQEKEVAYFPQNNVPSLLGKPPVSQHRINEEFHNGAQSSIKFPLIHFATENQDAYFILKYLDMDASWTTYYKLMEAVENFAQNKGIELSTVKNNRKRFTNTANNFSLSGFDSRHGFKDAAKQNKTDSMTIDEAYGFVSEMAKEYLKKAYFGSRKP